MYILDKNKDYYDYLSGIYGVDKSITFDRRCSTVVSNIDIAYITLRSRAASKQKEEKHILLEVGNTQYVFEVDIYSRDGGVYGWTPFTISVKLICIFKDNKNYSGEEMAFIPVTPKHYFSWKGESASKRINSIGDLTLLLDHKVSRPILKNTFVPAYISPEEIWKELSNFISSKQNDKNVDIINSDTDKIINHGFDKRSSFRHPIKL